MGSGRPVLGIDLGTSNSCVAYVEGEEVRVVTDERGRAITPSFVSLTDAGDFIVGHFAKAQRITNPHGTLYSAKRFLGQDFDSPGVLQAVAALSFSVQDDGNNRPVCRIRDRYIRPLEVSTQVLLKIKSLAETYLKVPVGEAVITVPAHFNDRQRKDTIQSAEAAGLKVLRLINEPTAAALAYGYGYESSSTIAIYDFGGGTFDVSVLEIEDNVFEVIATGGDSFLGGDDLNHAIANHVVERYLADKNIDIRQDRISMQRVLDAAERAKIELSDNVETVINLPRIAPNIDFNAHLYYKLTRDELDSLSIDLVNATLDICAKTFADARIGIQEIDDVVLVGGSTRMPLVRQRVAEYFGKTPNVSVNPDQAVAVGAAIQAHALCELGEDVLLIDVTPVAFGIESLGNIFTPIIPKNTKVPFRYSKVFTTAMDYQEEVRIKVFQGEGKHTTDCTFLGEFVLAGIRKAKRREPQIEVSFRIDANGVLQIAAKDLDTGIAQSIRIRDLSTGEAKVEHVGDDVAQAEANAASSHVTEVGGGAGVRTIDNIRNRGSSLSVFGVSEAEAQAPPPQASPPQAAPAPPPAAMGAPAAAAMAGSGPGAVEPAAGGAAEFNFGNFGAPAPEPPAQAGYGDPNAFPGQALPPAQPYGAPEYGAPPPQQGAYPAPQQAYPQAPPGYALAPQEYAPQGEYPPPGYGQPGEYNPAGQQAPGYGPPPGQYGTDAYGNPLPGPVVPPPGAEADPYGGVDARHFGMRPERSQGPPDLAPRGKQQAPPQPGAYDPAGGVHSRNAMARRGGDPYDGPGTGTHAPPGQYVPPPTGSGSGSHGQYQVPPGSRSGAQYPAPGSRSGAQYPAPGSRSGAQYPAPGSRSGAQYAAPGSGGHYPAAPQADPYRSEQGSQSRDQYSPGIDPSGSHGSGSHGSGPRSNAQLVAPPQADQFRPSAPADRSMDRFAPSGQDATSATAGGLTGGGKVPASLEEAIEPGRIIAGRYELMDKVGAGAFGAVFKAKQMGIDREVAIKLLMPEVTRIDATAVQRFEREAKVSASLEHPNTIAVHDFGHTSDGILYLVMEYVRGRTLHRVMRKTGPMQPLRVVSIIRQVLLSLHEAHTMGIVHRDMKPGNIMLFDRLGEKDVVKVLDFGIAKFISDKKDGQPKEDLTMAGRIVGTPRYMAPEQVRGKGAFPASDLYSLGLIMYGMLAGKKAITGDSTVELIAQQMSPEPAVKSDDVHIPPIMLPIILRATAKDLQQRYQNSEEFLNDLLRLNPADLAQAAPDATQADVMLGASGPGGPDQDGFFSRLFKK